MNKTEFKIGDKVMVEGTVVELGDWFDTGYARIEAQAGTICIPMQYLAPAQQEKVKVPQIVADWYRITSESGGNPLAEFVNLILTMGKNEGRNPRYNYDTGMYKWIKEIPNAIQIVANMYQFGYEVEQEKLYRVPLKHLKVFNGQQYLSKSIHGMGYFYANPLVNTAIQEFTMNEIPEEYRQWAEEVK